MCTYNIQESYVSEDKPCMGILVASELLILCTQNIIESYTLVQMIFEHGMILLIKQYLDCDLIVNLTVRVNPTNERSSERNCNVTS